MKDVKKLLSENRSGYLATVKNGEPRVRPFEFQFEDSGKYFFCTSNKKEVFSQLISSPFVEFSSTSKDYVTVRIRGKIEFFSNRALKERIIDGNELIRRRYQTPDYPDFEVFLHIEHREAVLSDFSGTQPVTREF